jgi:uncharacterized protein (TIGR00297 family)
MPDRRLAVAAIVALIFASLARSLRGVTRSGALAGMMVCFVLYASAGWAAFVALLSVFVLAWTTTRLGSDRKRSLGTAERPEGRKASQVMANLGMATACALAYAASGRAVSLLALCSALAEAAADTVSSEIGQASRGKTRLITTWAEVEPGTDGGITLAGTLAGIAAAMAVSLTCVLSGLIPPAWFPVAAAAASGGMVADSILGACLERRGWLNNDATNFLGTAVAVGLSLLTLLDR